MALAVAGVVWLIPACDRPPEEEQERPRPVKAIRLEAAPAETRRTYFGTSKPVEEVTLSFRVGGPLVELPIEVGRRVSKGDLLARIDPRDYEVQVRKLASSVRELKADLKLLKAGARIERIRALEAQLAGARAALQEAELQYERARNLREDDSLPKARLDAALAARDGAAARVGEIEQRLAEARAGARVEEIEAQEARIDEAEAQLAEAQDALGDTRLPAPFDGRVAEKYVENFQAVAAGAPVVRLVDLSRVEVEIGLPGEMVIRRKSFVGVICRFDACPGYTWPGRITEVAPVADPHTQTYSVTVVVEQQPGCELLAGLPASVEITVAQPPGAVSSGYAVPAQAVVSERPGSCSVWVIDERAMTVHRRDVTVGALTDGAVCLTSGVEAGELVVTAGASYLKEGQKVRLLEETRGKTAGEGVR